MLHPSSLMKSYWQPSRVHPALGKHLRRLPLQPVSCESSHATGAGASHKFDNFLQVMPYAWGEPGGCLPQAPDVIAGADVVYEQEHYAALVSSLHTLAAPHTVIYLSSRLRGTARTRHCVTPDKAAGAFDICASGICLIVSLRSALQ